MIKLIDVKQESEMADFGTCELCSFTTIHNYDVLVFADETGETLHMENGGWDWGDYSVMFNIDSYTKLAQWFVSNPLSVKLSDVDAEQDIIEHIWEYENTLEEED